MEQYITGAYTSILGRVTKEEKEGKEIVSESTVREPGYDEKARAGTKMRTLLSLLKKLGSIYFTTSEIVKEWSNVYSPECLTGMVILYVCLDNSTK